MSRALSPKQVEAKRLREQAVVTEMIATYCRGNHGTGGKLCPACAELATYAARRVERCPYMATKTFCSRCEVHCYAPEMRGRIRQVMRYAGPRMLIRHPLMTVHHALDTLAAQQNARAQTTRSE